MVKVKDVMTGSGVAFQQGHSMDVLCDVMALEEVGCVPVVGDDYRFSGVVTYRDVMFRLSGESREDSEGLTIADVMRRDIMAVSPEESLSRALMCYLENGVGCLPVVVDGLLVGMVTEKVFLSVLPMVFSGSIGDRCVSGVF